jgi:hypothetical protein
MKPTAMIKADFITSVVLIAFSIAYMVESYRMPRLEAQNINPWSAPGVVPGFLGLILLVLGLVLFVRSVFKGGHRLGWTAATARETFVQPSMFRLGATALLCLLYAGFMMGNTPYWLATFLFVSAFTAIFEWNAQATSGRKARGIAAAAILGAATSAIVSVTFEYGFLVTLP